MVYIIIILFAIEIVLISEILQLKSELHFLRQVVQYRHEYLLKEIRKVKEND